MPVVKNPVVHNSSEIDIESNDNSQMYDSILPQPTTTSPLPPLCAPPELLTATTHTPPIQCKATSVHSDNNVNPQPVVFTVAFDDEQQLDDQDKVFVEPKHKQPSGTNANKIPLLPKLDLKRSRSAAEALNLSHTSPDVDVESQFTSSTEYPYVLHAFEAVGKERVHIGSLPNMLQFTQCQYHTPQSNFDTDSLCDNELYGSNMFGNEHESPGEAPYATVEFNIDSDDEPAYSYADRRDIIQNATDRNMQNGSNILNQDYQYGEHPSSWTPGAQPALKFAETTKVSNDCQSPDYQEVDETLPMAVQSGSAVHPFSQVSLVKQSVDHKNSAPLPMPKPKPPVQPRNKLAQKHVSSNYITQPSVGTHTVERSHQPPTEEKVNLAQPIAENQNGVDASSKSTLLGVQTPDNNDKYTKLRPTMDEFQHTYMHLLSQQTILSQTSKQSQKHAAHPKQ